jgi:hypothetical protein
MSCSELILRLPDDEMQNTGHEYRLTHGDTKSLLKSLLKSISMGLEKGFLTRNL